MDSRTYKREFQRIEAELTISIYHERWVHPINVKSKDISLGGIFVYTMYTDDLKPPMHLSITLPTADERYVTFNGEVAHALPGIGVGIRFLTKSKHLSSLIDKIKRGSPENPLKA